jgi:hypothetical protein
VGSHPKALLLGSSGNLFKPAGVSTKGESSKKDEEDKSLENDLGEFSQFYVCRCFANKKYFCELWMRMIAKRIPLRVFPGGQELFKTAI